MPAKRYIMAQDDVTKGKASPKQESPILKLTPNHIPWTLVKGSAMQIARMDLDKIRHINVHYSKEYGHLYAIVHLDKGYVSWQLDKNFKGEEGDEIDPATFMVYKLTNGYKTIERCNGKPMTPKMKNISLFNDKSIGIYINEDTLQIPELELIPILRGHKIGFIDSKARIVIEPVYDRFKGKFLDKYDYICVKQGGKWGVVDSEGGICLKTEYDYIIQGVVDYDLLPMDRDYLFTVCKEKQYAVFDNDARGGENCLVDFGKYDWIGGFDSRLAIVRKGNQYGMIDYSGALVLPVEYNHIDEFYNKGKTSTKAYKSGKEKTIKFSDLVCQGGYNDESYYGYSSGYNDSLSAYNNSYYNDALDFDQQSEDFWESL